MYSTNMYSIKKWANKIQGEQNSWVETTESEVQATVMCGNNIQWIQQHKQCTAKCLVSRVAWVTCLLAKEMKQTMWPFSLLSSVTGNLFSIWCPNLSLFVTLPQTFRNSKAKSRSKFLQLLKVLVLQIMTHIPYFIHLWQKLHWLATRTSTKTLIIFKILCFHSINIA